MMPKDPLLQRLSELPWPQPAIDRPPVEAGQLWRAAWQDTACLVVVLEAPLGRQVLVAAASGEEPGDETAVLAATDTGLSPLVWGSVAASIKVFTLEHRLADLSAGSFAAVQDAVRGDKLNTWAHISSPLDDRSLVRADLLDSLDYLANAEWVPRTSGVPLSEQTEKAGLGVAEVARTLEIPPGDARALLHGKRALKANEVGTLTELFDAVPMEAIAYDEELVGFMDLPEYRERLGMWGASRRLTNPVSLRRSFADELMPMAPRMRSGSKRDWRTLIEEVLGAP